MLPLLFKHIEGHHSTRYAFVQDRLLDMTVSIDERLEYFQELEQATRMLNHPGESLVLQTDFLYMVERVDICIDYLKSHVCSENLVIAIDDSSPLTATLQRSRNIPTSLPTMHDARYDFDQDVLRGLVACANHGRFQTTSRESERSMQPKLCAIMLIWSPRMSRQRRRCTCSTLGSTPYPGP